MPREPRQNYLGDDNADRLGRMVVQLLSEVWALRDRMAVMEELLRRKGVASPAEIDELVPDAALEARLTRLRAEMVESVLGAPDRNSETVESLVAKGRLARSDATQDPQPSA